MPDPDLEIREAQSFRPPFKPHFGLKIRGGGKRAPWAPSLDPLLEGMYH